MTWQLACPWIYLKAQIGKENTEISPYAVGQLVFFNKADIYNGERHFLQQVVFGKLDSHMLIKLEQSFTPFTKLNSKWLKDLLRHDTIKLLEENTGKIFSDINCTNVFLSQSPRAKSNKSKDKQMGPNQTYKLFHSKKREELVAQLFPALCNPMDYI